MKWSDFGLNDSTLEVNLRFRVLELHEMYHDHRLDPRWEPMTTMVIKSDNHNDVVSVSFASKASPCRCSYAGRQG
jgi:hypothetical protein